MSSSNQIVPAPTSNPITSTDITYLINTYNQYINMVGLQITYMPAYEVQLSGYNQPVIAYGNVVISGAVTNVTDAEYNFEDVGLVPTQYSVLWFPAANPPTLIPQIGDHFLWKNLEWELRNVYPVVIGSSIVYYRCIARRAFVSPNASLGSGS